MAEKAWDQASKKSTLTFTSVNSWSSDLVLVLRRQYPSQELGIVEAAVGS